MGAALPTIVQDRDLSSTDDSRRGMQGPILIAV